MKIVAPEHTKTTPWANGTGVTHEYARASGPKGYAWRMSLAEVTQDGAFSTFPGMARILTVVQGGGMKLCAIDEDLSARPLTPLQFSGDLALDGRLVEGPVRNFNLIYDPNCICAQVRVLRSCDSAKCLATVGRSYAIYVAHGLAKLGGHHIVAGNLALFDEVENGVWIEEGGVVLLYQLDQI